MQRYDGWFNNLKYHQRGAAGKEMQGGLAVWSVGRGASNRRDCILTTFLRIPRVGNGGGGGRRCLGLLGDPER